MSALVVMLQTEALTALGNRARTALEQTEMVQAGGTAVKRLLVDHFTELNTDRHRAGGTAARTGFYADAARSVNAAPVQADGKSALISIDKLGLAQRLLGGTIRPLPPHKYLAIPNPNNPDVIGKTPADFTNLQFFKTKRGGGLKAQREVASIVGRLQTGKNKGKSKSIGSEIGDVVMFWLVPEVTQAPDPTVLPDDEAMQETAAAAMDNFLTRRLASN